MPDPSHTHTTRALTVALISEIFPGPADGERLRRRLQEAAERGAALAVLPELPLNPWSPRSKTPLPGDAEPPGGLRHRLLAEAAASAGIAVVGGAIVTDRAGARHGTALVFDSAGGLAGTYAKVHLPEEPGFWETSHYRPGPDPPGPIHVPGLPLVLGVQLCSDANRPAGVQLLCARGAELIVVPRATEPRTWRRWRMVLRSSALTGAAWLVSVNRPAGADQTDVPIGGPSFAAGPDGEVVLESPEPMSIVTLDVGAIRAARTAYPGYLSGRPEVYVRGWSSLLERGTEHGKHPQP